MRKVIFLSLTAVSIISYVLAGLLLGIYFTQESPGMIMVFLVPLLISGILFAVIAVLFKKVKKFELGPFSVWIHYLNLILFVFGLIALIYTFSE